MINVFVLLILSLSIPGVVLVARALEAATWRHSLVAFKLTPPPTLTGQDVARWLMTVCAATPAVKVGWLPAMLQSPPVALELSGSADRSVEYFLLVSRHMQRAIQSGLRASMPAVRLEAAPDYLTDRPHFVPAGEAKLSNHRRSLDVEYAGTATAALLSALHPLYGAEEIRFQWIFTGAGISRRVPPATGRAKSADSWPPAVDLPTDQEAVQAARLKQQAQLLHAVGRVGIAGTPSESRAYELFGVAWAALRVINADGVGIVRRWLPSAWVARRMERLKMPWLPHWPLTLNTEELAGLLGLVVDDLSLPGLTLDGSRPLPPPHNMPTDGTIVGVSDYDGLEGRPLAIRTGDRLLHTYVVGQTGTGKSTLLCNLALQDINAGRAVFLIDPKNDLVEAIADRYPAARDPDLFVLDLSETATPIGFNPLAVGDDVHERELVVDGVLHIFYELYSEFWGPRTDEVLRFALLTLVHCRAFDGSNFTLCEVPEFLMTGTFRRGLLQQPLPEHLRRYWAWYDTLKPAEQASMVGPVLNKLRAFTTRTPMRLVLGQSTGLDLASILDNGQVLLVNLAKGKIGAPTAALMGSLLVLQLQFITLRRAVQRAEARPQFMAYIDEVQDVLRVDALADMLAQFRGFGGGLTLANQYLHQLSPSLAHALGTVRNHIIFQTGPEDARALAPSLAPWLTGADLEGLGTHHAVVRPCIDGRTAAPVTMKTLPLSEPTRDGRALAKAARERHGVPQHEVEAALQARLQTPVISYSFGRSPRAAQP